MSYLVNALYLLRFTLMSFQANREGGRYHRLARKRAASVIRQSRMLNDGSVSERAYLKIQWYMVSTLFMGELAGSLVGKRFSPKEEKAYCYLGALIGLSDILVDDYRLEELAMEALLQEHPTGDTAIEQIFRLYYRALIQEVDAARASRLKKAFSELIHFQIASLRQFDTGISEPEVEAITRGKGGASLRLCYALLPRHQAALQKAFYQLGGFIQFLNDAQDLPKDARDGVTTLIHFRKDFSEVLTYLETERRAVFRAFRGLPLRRQRRNYFLFCFHAMFVLITFKLDHYAHLCGPSLSLAKITARPSADFRVNPFSLRFVWHCFSQIIRYRPDAVE